jgi:hypothetical protein
MAGMLIHEPFYGTIVHISLADADTYFNVDGKRYYMSYHNYCGPSFFWDINHDDLIDYDDIPEGHKVWTHFEKWLVKFDKAKAAKEAARIAEQKKEKKNENPCNWRGRIHRDEPVQVSIDGRKPRQPRNSGI